MGSKFLKKREVARLVTENRQPCVFCNEDVDDEVIYGKLYAYGDIQCHYYCVLLSCCLVQKGRESEGLFGFLYKDILAEVERSKKHRCSYCGKGGASLGCSVTACRKQFHLPCGRRKNVVSLFYGNYKSFCELHAPKQKISNDVMEKAKERMKKDRLIKAGKIPIRNGEEIKQTEGPEDPAMVCVICYEDVQAYPTTQTFWPPCCGRDAWLHRSCLQRMALSAGMHYLKCPLCNDKENFYDAVCEQGYYLPDRDAAWELEQNAFAEIYERNATCAAAECKCPFGRKHDELGMWDIKLCLLCGSWGMHAFCSGGERSVCVSCKPAAKDIEQLETRLTEVILVEQAREQDRQRSGPVMPSRMSLRRTKGRVPIHSASSSSQYVPTQEAEKKTESQSPTTDRLELNLKTPVAFKLPKLLTPNLKDLESKLLSPIKMLEQTYLEKGGGRDVVVSNEVIEKIRQKFSKPKPLSAKKKILNEILDDLFKTVFMDSPKSKDALKEWNSPKKTCDVVRELNEGAKKNLIPILYSNIFDTREKDPTSVEADDNAKVEKEENEENQEHLKDSANKIPVELDTSSDKENDQNNVNDNNENLETREKDPTSVEADDNANVGKEKNEENQEHVVIKDSANETLGDLDTSSDKENDQNNMNDNNENLNTIHTETGNNDVKNDDESSRSTFQLAPEFIADSEDDLRFIETPKKLKMVDIKQDSMEISEDNEIINIDVVPIESGEEKEFVKSLGLKSPAKKNVFSFKFSPLDKEPIKTDINIDVESFKDRYLNEVGRDNYNSHLKNDETKCIDTNDSTDATPKKRKLDVIEGVNKKRKGSKKHNKDGKKHKKDSKKHKRLRIKIKSVGSDKATEKRIVKKMKELKKLVKHNPVSIQKLKDELKHKIKKSKKNKVKTYKQYVIKYSQLERSNVIEKPDVDVTPMKRKYIKMEKSPGDNLVQTSIASFFTHK